MAFTSETAREAGKKSTRSGKPNRNTAEIRERFKDLLENNLETIQKDLEQLEPRERIKALLDLARYVVPTLRATELKTDLNREIVINFTED